MRQRFLFRVPVFLIENVFYDLPATKFPFAVLRHLQVGIFESSYKVVVFVLVFLELTTDVAL